MAISISKIGRLGYVYQQNQGSYTLYLGVSGKAAVGKLMWRARSSASGDSTFIIRAGNDNYYRNIMSVNFDGTITSAPVNAAAVSTVSIGSDIYDDTYSQDTPKDLLWCVLDQKIYAGNGHSLTVQIATTANLFTEVLYVGTEFDTT